MREHKAVAVTAGTLYITGTVAGILSRVLEGPVRDTPHPLAYAAAHPDRVVTSALLVLVMALSLLFVPVVLFPILRRVDEALAVGYLALRGAVEACCYVISAIGLLLLLPAADVLAAGTGTATTGAGRLGVLLVDLDAAQGAVGVVFCLGGVLFYTLLYRSGLVPRWIAVWGLAGVPPYLAAFLLMMYGVIGSSSTQLTILVTPLGLQEMVLGLWMILRGFRQTTPSRPPQRAEEALAAVP